MMQHQRAPAQKSNTNPKLLVKVVVSTDAGKWRPPAADATFEIDATPKFPAINFEIDTPTVGPYKWTWTITWNAKVSGGKESIKRGSSVRVFSETGTFDSDKKIRAANPKKDDVMIYLATIVDASGFDKILEQKSHYKNVIDADGQPIVAFDKGYGMTQLTHPVPT